MAPRQYELRIDSTSRYNTRRNGRGICMAQSQMKGVRDELKTDIKRVEDKLDNKEKEPRQEFRSDVEKTIAQACENLGSSIRAGRIDIYSLEANLRFAFDK